MASTEGDEILGQYYLVQIDRIDNARIFSPTIINGYSSDSSNVPHTFRLYFNNELVETLESEDSTFNFKYNILDKSLLGETVIFSVSCTASQVQFPIYDDDMYIDVVMPTISESLMEVFNEFKSILDEIGVDTSEAQGLTSLIELVEVL